MSEALCVRHLQVRRGQRDVLCDISFNADFGSITAVLGPNGAGKSTLLKAVLGIVPSSGEIVLAGEALASLNSAARARRVAYVPQRSELNVALSVESVVAQGRFAHVRQEATNDAAVVQRALAATDTLELAQRSFTRLSHGERQRVLIARALATGSRILLLDEPTASLDVGHALHIYALLRELATQGYAVLMAMHPLADALSFTDSALLLASGKSCAHGKTPEIIAPGLIESVYGVRLIPNGALGFESLKAVRSEASKA
jgi:iron complex transport system ATP-binding protein